jgi:quercetin dioxygenase-like cupin family protein
MTSSSLPAAQALALRDLVTPTAHGIASRVLAKAPGGNVTLFSFDAGQGLTEHTSSYEALVLVLEGHLDLTVAGDSIAAPAGAIVRLPADVPHALDAPVATRMLLIMVK